MAGMEKPHNVTEVAAPEFDPKNHDYSEVEKKLDDLDSSASRTDDDSIFARFTEREQRSIIHKIDRRLIPVAGIMYCVSLLDRTNLGNANIAGMEKDLHLDIGARYSIITLVFFITYVIFQPPATVLIRKIGPRIFLPGICFLWGCTLIGFGFVDDWNGLIGLRMLLGVLEAGFFPGAVYLLSTWYSRYDMGKRYACFYIIGACASGLGGILAYGLMQMAGTGGYPGWSWIFIIEGVITVAVAIFSFLTLLSFPDDTKSRTLNFLSDDEKRYIIARVNRDRADADLPAFSLKNFLRPALDLRIWGFAFIFGASTTVSYALAFFLPIILVGNMGFDIGKAQCLVAPPYAFAAILMFCVGWASDKYKQRGLALVFNSIVAIIGLTVMGFADTPAVRYFGAFFATAGANGNVPVTLTYQANNIRGQWKRAFCSATLVGMGGVGGIVGSTVFRKQDSPTYIPGLGVSIGANVLIIAIVGVLSLHFRKKNRQADNGEIVIAETPGFRYTF